MPLSRLRLRLTARYAFAFALGLGLLSALALGYLWREATRRLHERLDLVAQGAVQALKRELAETPDSSLAFAAREVVAEWPINDDSFGIIDESGALVAAADRANVIDSAMYALRRTIGVRQYVFANGEQDYRVSVPSMVEFRDRNRVWKFGVIAYRSTEGMEGDIELVGGALAVGAPIIALLSLVVGYVLARRALQPIDDLRAEIAAIVPGELERRVAIVDPRDEIGALATDFNALLGRLAEAQQRNHRFVREAAHQIRTPLTLVLGEASHELSNATVNTGRANGALARIHTAAEQMQHRVNDLLLLAEAQSGEAIRIEDDVELDGLVLECTDLMRARASVLGRSLAIGRAEPLTVRGHTMLLREALLELIENGMRHGAEVAPVTVSAYADGDIALLEVSSAGSVFALPADDTARAPESLGLPIVRWIARGHGGELRLTRVGDCNCVAVTVPMVGGEVAGTTRMHGVARMTRLH